MARSEHNREAYRALFGYVGAGLQAFAGLMIVASIPIAPLWLVVTLLVLLVVGAAWSWKQYTTNFMMPTFIGTALAIGWMVGIGVGVGIAGWSP
ncbi:MAG: hypothetical protein M5U23_04060 [Acidimicrobiia bacterium]|nr:hypothetical protein [Acidimicrobiia bacterium]